MMMIFFCLYSKVPSQSLGFVGVPMSLRQAKQVVLSPWPLSSILPCPRKLMFWFLSLSLSMSSSSVCLSLGHTTAVSPLTVSNILANVPSNIKAVLENEARWDFDILNLERVTEHRPLVWLGMAVFVRFDAFSFLKCNETTLQNWLTLIEANYHSQNAYHNSTHAADVLQATAYFLQRDKIKVIVEWWPSDDPRLAFGPRFWCLVFCWRVCCNRVSFCFLV